MSAPTWEQYMAPALRALSDGEVHRTREVVATAADDLDLSLEHRAILIPSGQEQWVNRGNWALSYLARAGAVERPSRGHYRITQIGRDLVAQHSNGITERDLRAVPGYASPRHGAKPLPPPDALWAAEEPVLDPVEQIETGIDRIEAEVAADLLSRLHGQEPAFFEQAVLDLLIAMGYGGAEGRATRTRQPGQPGRLHHLREVQHSGARLRRRCRGRVVLIDGDRLARLMIRYGVGVQVRRAIKIV